MRSLLLGNGIDIQFGGAACTSKFIIKRIKYRALMDSYAELFDYKMSAQEIVNLLKGFVSVANDIIQDKYDIYATDIETSEALADFHNRYKEVIKNPEDIMLEDWLFIVHMFFLKNCDLEESRTSAIQGFERLLLDAIYNDGEIQNIQNKIPKSVRKYLKKYDAIFTLNYDNNIEAVTGKKVYHLHGDFSELASSENENVAQGYLRIQNQETVVMDDMRHCFCNALLNYSGKLKKKRIDECDAANKAFEKLYEFYKSDPIQIEKLKGTQSTLYNQILAKISNPELKATTDYHYEDFSKITDELSIIGMSPNNDAHIFEAILNNKRLSKVIFYYRDPKHKDYIEANYPTDLFECRDVNQLWIKLRCENKTLNCTYQFPEKIDDYVNAFNALSDDPITTDQVKKELKHITRSDMEKICRQVKADINSRNPEHKPTDEKEFIKQNASISYIGLQQGILPTVVYLVCVMNFDLIRD